MYRQLLQILKDWYDHWTSYRLGAYLATVVRGFSQNDISHIIVFPLAESGMSCVATLHTGVSSLKMIQVLLHLEQVSVLRPDRLNNGSGNISEQQLPKSCMPRTGS
jgi:hypothetical protein